MRRFLIVLLASLFLIRPVMAEPVHDCDNIPFCCPGPGNYPTAPSHGTNCALTVAAMAVPIIIIVGIAGIILATGNSDHAH
jgi:hypothetical protein